VSRLRVSVERAIRNKFQKNRKVLNFRTKGFLELRFRKQVLFELVSKLEMSSKKCEKYIKGLTKFRAKFTYFLSINKSLNF
jgi:hypothetical protein